MIGFNVYRQYVFIFLTYIISHQIVIRMNFWTINKRRI